MQHLKFPIGKFIFPNIIDEESLTEHINMINDFPAQLQDLVNDMTEDELDNPYRSEGWTARQVVHHLADSHSHALMRFKWTLTEDSPTIKPYFESKYALLSDYTLPIDSAISILKGVHLKWKTIMDHMKAEDWAKGYKHPETNRFIRLDEAVAMYDWHCRHHLAHIQLCKKA
jgi:hypothetical protein